MLCVYVVITDLSIVTCVDSGVLCYLNNNNNGSLACTVPHGTVHGNVIDSTVIESFCCGV